MAPQRDPAFSPLWRAAKSHPLPLGTQALCLPGPPGLAPHVAGVVTNAVIQGWGQNAHVAAGAGGDTRKAPPQLPGLQGETLMLYH